MTSYCLTDKNTNSSNFVSSLNLLLLCVSIVLLVTIMPVNIAFSGDLDLSVNDKSNRIDTSPLSWLTSEEIAWLKEHQSIRISGPKAFPPFHYFGKDGTVQGISSEYMQFLMEKLGVELQISENLLWPEVLNRAKNRELDVIACAAKTKDRDKYLEFSESYLSFPMVIITRKDAPFMSGLNDLHGKTVAFIVSISTYEWLIADKINTIPHMVNTPLEALKSVSTGRTDAYIGNLAAASYMIEKNGLTNLKIAAPTRYGNYNLHFAVRKDWPELVSIINKTLQTMGPEEHTQIRNRWLSVRYEFGIRPRDFVKWGAGIVGIAVIILAVILYWNRKLKNEIVIRKQTETDLQRALDSVKTLEGLLPICASCKKIRDDSGYWNQIEVYIEDHSDALFSHGICPDCAHRLYGDRDWYKRMDKGIST